VAGFGAAIDQQELSLLAHFYRNSATMRLAAITIDTKTVQQRLGFLPAVVATSNNMNCACTKISVFGASDHSADSPVQMDLNNNSKTADLYRNFKPYKFRRKLNDEYKCLI
jgi:hypothetical protein